MKLLISAGGEGTRLYPLTKDIPKQMLRIAGKPVLEHLVEWGKKYGIREVVMISGRKGEKVSEYFGDGRRLGVEITHLREPYPLGTGGIIRFARPVINSRFAYISGDVITDINLDKMVEFHEKSASQITAHVHKSSHPHDSDILDVYEDGKVRRFISKHDSHEGAGELTNSGLTIIEPEILDLMEEEVFNFENYLYPILLRRGIKFYAYNTDEFMQDMGTFDRLKKCEDYLQGKHI